MTRRFFGGSMLALLTGCAGAGVSTVDLRGKVAAEIAQVVVTRTQLAPWIFSTSVDGGKLDAAIDTVQNQVAATQADAFSVEQLHDLRQFYSSREGQDVVALAYAAEGGGDKPSFDAEQFERVEASLANPLIARSVASLRDVLRGAFASEFSFR